MREKTYLAGGVVDLSWVYCQVRITTPQLLYRAHELIAVSITNMGSQPVSICVEFGQSSLTPDGQAEATPIPVYVQRETATGWSTLLTGRDVGSSRMPMTLEAGRSQLYPFRLAERGSLRLVLDYWIGDNQHACESPSRGRSARSRIFVVQ